MQAAQGAALIEGLEEPYNNAHKAIQEQISICYQECGRSSKCSPSVAKATIANDARNCRNMIQQGLESMCQYPFLGLIRYLSVLPTEKLK